MRKVTRVLVALNMLLAGCGTQKIETAAVLPTVPQEVSCNVGSARVIDGTEFRIDILTVWENSQALARVNGQTASDYGMEIYADVKAGLVPRFDGATTAVITLHGVRTSLLPKKLPYLSGMAPTGPHTKDGICRGYAEVKIVGSRAEVTVPVLGGEHLGQVSVIFPRVAFVGIPDALPCVTWGVPIYAPTLTRGPMRGVENTLCGMPSGDAGKTLFGKRVGEEVRWTLSPGVVKR